MSRNKNFLRYDVEQNLPIFERFMLAAGFRVLVTETTRTDAEQYQHYLNGASQATTPSFHSEHAGLAFDICQDAPTYNEQWNDAEFWEAAGRIGKAMGFTWGGDWTGFIDKPHFQWDAHGQYTGDMIRAKQYPPDMPLYKTSVEIVAERYGFNAPDYWHKTTTGEVVPTPENMAALFGRIAGR